MKHLAIDLKGNLEDKEYIHGKIIEYNKKYLSSADMEFISEDFCFTIKDEKGEIFGGVSGRSKRQILFIDFLWINENIRKRGFGIKLIEEVENFATKRKCKMIMVDTFSFQAPDFYKNLGYEIYGELEDFPEGFNHYFLYKKI
ncbi:GNAT family N-acetyltransferase [Miniphocaeibacter halophilus]|uniref:GNAT family N-acetyltransferase n=1 Tax=Miniphocaeibacter halophilus TaxID=2931922 RepID=A0AC61MPW1_9FIRM|nr:GNAT family N-acetyltransferase [Miniphocaeibacter halophilus]QQK07273.1 GNAT family N-acetyltransferase [Miniphocaeibacter halophilus]